MQALDLIQPVNINVLSRIATSLAEVHNILDQFVIRPEFWRLCGKTTMIARVKAASRLSSASSAFFA